MPLARVFALLFVTLEVSSAVETSNHCDGRDASCEVKSNHLLQHKGQAASFKVKEEYLQERLVELPEVGTKESAEPIGLCDKGILDSVCKVLQCTDGMLSLLEVKEELALEKGEGQVAQAIADLFDGQETADVKDVCEKVVGALEDAGMTLPPASDQACICLNGEETCGIDVSPWTLSDEMGKDVPDPGEESYVDPEEDDKSVALISKFQAEGRKVEVLAKSKRRLFRKKGPKAGSDDFLATGLSTGTIHNMVRSPQSLLRDVANIFRIYPAGGCLTVGGGGGQNLSLAQRGTATAQTVAEMHAKANAWLSLALARFDTSATQLYRQMWFGTSGTRPNVQEILNSVKSVFDTGVEYVYPADLQYGCSVGSVYSDGTIASGTVAVVYHYTSGAQIQCTQTLAANSRENNGEHDPCTVNGLGQHVVYLCEFWGQDGRSAGSRVQTMIHEAAHHRFAALDDTSDGSLSPYGRDDNRARAENYPQSAINNAASFQFYIFDVVHENELGLGLCPGFCTDGGLTGTECLCPAGYRTRTANCGGPCWGCTNCEGQADCPTGPDLSTGGLGGGGSSGGGSAATQPPPPPATTQPPPPPAGSVSCGDHVDFSIQPNGAWRPTLTVPSGTESIEVSTCGSNFDTYIKAPCSNDDSCGRQSTCTFTPGALADANNQLSIEGYGDAAGSGTLHITCTGGGAPPTTTSPPPPTTTSPTPPPTTNAPPPAGNSVSCGQHVPFTIEAWGDWRPTLQVPAGTESVTISTCASADFDTKIVAPCSNDDASGCGTRSRCTFTVAELNAVNNELRVSGYGSQYGSGNLEITCNGGGGATTAPPTTTTTTTTQAVITECRRRKQHATQCGQCRRRAHAHSISCEQVAPTPTPPTPTPPTPTPPADLMIRETSYVNKKCATSDRVDITSQYGELNVQDCQQQCIDRAECKYITFGLSTNTKWYCMLCDKEPTASTPSDFDTYRDQAPSTSSDCVDDPNWRHSWWQDRCQDWVGWICDAEATLGCPVTCSAPCTLR